MRRALALLAMICLVITGCGGSDDDAESGTTTAASTTVPSTASEGADTTSSSTTNEPTSSEPAPSPDPADLPGEVFDMFPYQDASLAVVGVDRFDVLNLRRGPGTEFAVVSELSPTHTGLISTGHNRMADGQIWAEVTVDGETGWVNNAYVLQFGSVDDITSELGEPGELPGGGTMIEVAEAVGQRRASDEPPSRVVVIEDPVVGDLGEIMVDVIGMGDDSVGGERLHILATPVADESFVVRSVERITLCSRGVTDDFRCT